MCIALIVKAQASIECQHNPSTNLAQHARYDMKPGIAKHAKQDMKPGIALQGPCQQSGQDMAPSHRCLFWLLAVTGSMEPYQQNGAAHWRSRSYKTWNWSTLASQVCYHCNNHIDAYNNSNKMPSSVSKPTMYATDKIRWSAH